MKERFLKKISINNVDYSIYVIKNKLVDFGCKVDFEEKRIYVNCELFDGNYNNFMEQMLNIVLQTYFKEYKTGFEEDNILIDFLSNKFFNIFNNIYDNDLIGRIEDIFANSIDNYSDFFVEKLSIMGVKYNLYLINGKSTPRFYGQSCVKDKNIFIAYYAYKENVIKETFFHELLHCYFFECSLLKYYDNEELIEFLEDVFFEIINNIWGFDFLVKIENIAKKMLCKGGKNG